MDEILGKLSSEERYNLLKKTSQFFALSLDGSEGKEIFRDWFLLSSERNDIVIRAGYAAGYEMVALFSKIFSINELVVWSMTDLKSKVDKYIFDLAF